MVHWLATRSNSYIIIYIDDLDFQKIEFLTDTPDIIYKYMYYHNHNKIEYQHLQN